jgi:aspartate ammonia-lyase
MRTETDSLGSLQLPDDAYYGIQTLRAVQNFPISGIKIHPTFIFSYGCLKRACIQSNFEAGLLHDKQVFDALMLTCNEVVAGKLSDQFVTDVFQAGAGTSTNMNFNEVIANRSLEILGFEKGNYERLSPNDIVNMSQSTNDTYPTAMRLASIVLLRDAIYPAFDALELAFQKKEREFSDALKSGRTHLQDAVPMTLGQEFGAWRRMVQRHRIRLGEAEEDLSYLGIGGTAVGTGLNAPPRFQELVVKNLNDALDLDLKSSENLFEAMESLAPFVHVMSSLKNFALDLLKISADLRLLASGPMTGFAEIALPAVQPGSSIMPGKVNPSILEMVSQVALQVVGAETTVSMASQAGQLELNVMMPVVQYNICFAMDILANALEVLSEKCILGISADRERLLHFAESSGSLVTALAPHLGYLVAADIAKESLKTRKTIRAIVFERGLLTEDELTRILDIHKMAHANREG